MKRISKSGCQLIGVFLIAGWLLSPREKPDPVDCEAENAARIRKLEVAGDHIGAAEERVIQCRIALRNARTRWEVRIAQSNLVTAEFKLEKLTRNQPEKTVPPTAD